MVVYVIGTMAYHLSTPTVKRTKFQLYDEDDHTQRWFSSIDGHTI